LEIGGVPEATLMEARTFVLTQFELLKQAKWLLKTLAIPASLRVWTDRPKDHGSVRWGAKDCPGGVAKFQIQLWHGHYFTATPDEVEILRDLFYKGFLRTRKIRDVPRRMLPVPLLHGGPYDPTICVQPWRHSTWKPKLKKVCVPKSFMEGWQISDGAAVWQIWTEFNNDALEGVCAYRGLPKAIAH
jgi:hypothetical protein